MTGDDQARMLYALGCLVLVASSLAARRLPLGQTLKMASAWVAIFGVVVLLYGFRDEARGLADRFKRGLYPEDGVVAGETLRIPMAEDGHFYATGAVNGVPVRFLVDSGASLVSITARTADQAGIDRTGSGIALETANGTIVAARIRIRQLDVGPIHREDVAGASAEAFGDVDVLGMNFLSSLSGWRVEGRTLILER